MILWPIRLAASFWPRMTPYSLQYSYHSASYSAQTLMLGGMLRTEVVVREVGVLIDIQLILIVVFIQFTSSVQSLSRVWLFVTTQIAVCQAYLPITNSWSSLRLTSIESVMPSSHFILCRPLLLLPPIPPSIKVFSNESTLRMRWPKYWSFSFSIIPSKKIPGLIFRMDWLDLLAVQGTLKSLLQHHSSKVLIRRCSAFSQSNTHIHTWPLEKPQPSLDGT